MEEYVPGKKGNKRSRDDSDLHESKRLHTEPAELELEVNHDRVSSSEFDETDAEVDVDSPEVKQIREDILDILDDPEEVIDGVPENQELDSVIKSFEEEILYPSTLLPQHDFVDLTLSDSGESQLDLGYLLEASDHELGLPPTVSPENHIDAETASRNTIGFEELMRFDSLDFGMLAGIMDGDNYGGENDGDFVTVGGLFYYPDPSNYSELSRLPESLPAL